MSEINWEDVLGIAREAAEDGVKDLLDEHKDELMALGKEGFKSVIKLVMEGKEEEATDEMLSRMQASDLAAASLANLTEDTEGRKKSQAFLGSILNVAKSIGLKILTSGALPL